MAIKVIALSSFWLLIGTMAGRIATLFANVFAARMLGPELFGQYMTVRATVATAENIFAGSIGNVAVSNVSQCIGDGSARLRSLIWRVILLSAGVGLAGAIAILAVAAYFGRTSWAEFPYLETSFYLGGLLLVVTLTSSVAIRITIGLAQFKAGALTSIAAVVISIPFIYYLTTNYGIYGALIALCVYFALDASLKSFAIVMGVSSAGQNRTSVAEGKSLAQLAKASTPLAIAILIGATTLWGVRIVAASRKNGFVELAYFDAAYQIFTVMMVLTGVTTSVALQMFSRAGPNGRQHRKAVLITHLAMNGLILATISVVVIAASREIMSLFGAEYATHRYLVPVLCAVSFVATAASVCEKLLISADRYSYVIAANVLGAIAAISTAWLAGPENQAIVLASATIAYYSGSTAFYTFAIVLQRRTLF
jgi:O-antigen/teichoic acid export membrane protein